MLTIRVMTAADHDAVMPMVRDFYNSPAVDHVVEPALLERAFLAAMNPVESLLWGLLLEDDGKTVGYSYLTQGYSAEAGGRMILIEELFLLPECRGKGYGSQVFQYLMDKYPGHVRFRLEVTDVNQDAIRLYKKLGFDFLEYRQMILDR